MVTFFKIPMKFSQVEFREKLDFLEYGIPHKKIHWNTELRDLIPTEFRRN